MTSFLITNFNIEDQVMLKSSYIASIKSTKQYNKNYDILMNDKIKSHFFWQMMLNSSQLILVMKSMTTQCNKNDDIVY